MNKTNRENVVVIIGGLLIGSVLAYLVFQAFFLRQAGATFNDNPFSECVQLKCGSSEGEQTREVTHYECPEGFNSFLSNSCIRLHPFAITSKVAVTTTETQACTVEEPEACVEEQPPCTGNCSPTFQGSTTEAPGHAVCTVGFEKARVWYGDNKFNWATDAQGIQKFSIVYGPTQDSLIYGVDNIPSSSRSMEINGRDGWNQTWFQVWTWKDNCAEKSAVIDP